VRWRRCAKRWKRATKGYNWGDWELTLDAQRMACWANRFVLWFTRHWLALVNSVLAVVLGLAFLAPWLMLHGHGAGGQLIYLLYRPLCHQLPERSFFLGGAQPWYSYEQLAKALGTQVPARYIGNGQLGYKVAFCERDVAIYAGYLGLGLIFGLFRRRMKPLPWQVVILAIIPMAIDGTIQLFGLAESTPLRRVLTGGLFGIAVMWFALPWVERGMSEAHQIAREGVEGIDAGKQ